MIKRIITCLILGILLIAITSVSAETLDSGIQTIPVRAGQTNNTRISVTDYDYGDVVFKKTNANLNSTFRIQTDTDTWLHTITVTNLKEVSLPGTPGDDYLGNMTADEFFQGMIDYGEVTFRLIGSGHIKWTFTDLPENIMSIEIDDETAEEGVDYEISGNDLTLTLNMSTHDVKAVLGDEALALNVNDESCVGVMLLVAFIVIGVMLYRNRKFSGSKKGKKGGYS